MILGCPSCWIVLIPTIKISTCLPESLGWVRKYIDKRLVKRTIRVVNNEIKANRHKVNSYSAYLLSILKASVIERLWMLKPVQKLLPLLEGPYVTTLSINWGQGCGSRWVSSFFLKVQIMFTLPNYSCFFWVHIMFGLVLFKKILQFLHPA